MRENFYPFELEREMGIWEHNVAYNLSESGVQPMTTRELFGGDRGLLEKFLDVELNYIQSNGSIQLRDQIAGIYSGATRDDVVVTVGAAQANFTSILTILDPGDEIVIMLPNYMQIWGAAKNLGLKVKTFSLKNALGWGFDIDDFHNTVTGNTRLIAVCNPNNPTGHIMTVEEQQAVISAADKVGAWILSDEVYAGAEHHTDEVTPSLWGTYDKVLAIGSMSKAYALPGLRIGWVVSNPEMANAIWARQDYLTICGTMLGDRLAAYALSPEVRPRILARTREYVRRGFSNLSQWVDNHSDIFSVTPPEAAAIAFVQYKPEINSSKFVNYLATQYDAYIVPGDHFGMDNYLRISYGLADDYVNEGLRRLYEAFMTFKG
jgi:aspartate/methionine/tyrosine aminotransferase